MEQNLYDLLGGEKGLRQLVDRFYERMDTLPEAKSIRAMHPDDISSSADKLFCFLSGWTGGPALFVEKYGHPMLRRRHFPFKIGKSERDQWMLCMVLAMEDLGYEGDVKEYLLEAFLKIADHMRNHAEEGG